MDPDSPFTDRYCEPEPSMDFSQSLQEEKDMALSTILKMEMIYGREIFARETGYDRFLEFIFLVIKPATRFRTRLLSITADFPSCCLFSSKSFEKYSFCLVSSVVPSVLMYDGLIPMILFPKMLFITCHVRG